MITRRCIFFVSCAKIFGSYRLYHIVDAKSRRLNTSVNSGARTRKRRAMLFRQSSAFRQGYFILPSPPMRATISSMRSTGKGGSQSGFMAMLMSFMGLSSAATRLELSAPQRLQRWIIAHSPFLRTHTAIGSIIPPQSLSRSPGSMSTCRLERQFWQ